jgi:hypothetical protein
MTHADHKPIKHEDFDCWFFGHQWTLVSADDQNMARWGCERCHRWGGLPSQHQSVPSRWLWTFWCGQTHTIYKIFTGQA